MNEHISTRIKKLVSEYKSVSEFAILTKNKERNIYNAIKGVTFPSYEVIDNICKYIPQLNTEWLIKGEGSMLKGEILEPPETKHIVQLDKMVGSSNETLLREQIKEQKLEIKELHKEISDLNKVIGRLEGEVKRLENKHNKPSLPNVYTTQQPQLIENKDIINEDCK